jgi:hypothetical protein
VGEVIDFAAVIAELREQGVHLDDVAKQAKIDRTAPYRYLTGTQPLHATGEAIIEHWRSVTGKTREQLPRV